MCHEEVLLTRPLRAVKLEEEEEESGWLFCAVKVQICSPHQVTPTYITQTHAPTIYNSIEKGSTATACALLTAA